MRTDLLEIEMKGLPVDLDAERFVLGSVLRAPESIQDLRAALDQSDFSVESHRRIFAAMLAMDDQGRAIDGYLLARHMSEAGHLESIGGLSAIASLDEGISPTFNLDPYAQRLQEKGLLRKAIYAAHGLINRCMAGGADRPAAEILSEAQSAISQLSQKRDLHGQWLRPGDVMTGYTGGLNAFLNPARADSGIATPWPSLTDMLCGLKGGDLILVAGRPSMGKSVIAMQIAHRAAMDGKGAAMISLEMSKESLVRRLICSEAQIDAQRMRSGHLTADERGRASSAANRIAGLPLFIDDTRARTVPAILAALRKLKAKESISVLLIDHLQLMKSAGRSESRHHELSEISHALKHLAADTGLVVILLSQLNRECEREKRRPQLADLKETGTLEEDADVVLFIHRPEQYNRQDPSLKGVSELITAKQRNGPTGKLNFTFLHGFQKFVEATGRDRE